MFFFSCLKEAHDLYMKATILDTRRSSLDLAVVIDTNTRYSSSEIRFLINLLAYSLKLNLPNL